MKSEFCTPRTASLGVFSLAIRLIACVCRHLSCCAIISSISLIFTVMCFCSLVMLLQNMQFSIAAEGGHNKYSFTSWKCELVQEERRSFSKVKFFEEFIIMA